MTLVEREKIMELQDFAAQFREAASTTRMPQFAEMMIRAAQELEELVQEKRSNEKGGMPEMAAQQI